MARGSQINFYLQRDTGFEPQFNSYKMQLSRVGKNYTTFVCINGNRNDAAVPDQDPVSPRRSFTN